MKILQDLKDAINDRSEAIFETYGVELRRGVAKCPFHDDKTPSFVAKPDPSGRWQWKCMACDAKGSDIFSFVAQIEGLDLRKDFVKIAEKAAAACGLSYAISDTDTTPISPRAPRATAPTPPAVYLNEAMEKMEQGVTSTNLFIYLCRLYDPTEVQRVMAAYHVGLAHYLDPRKKWSMSAGALRLQNSYACSAFPYIDAEGRTIAIKAVPYSKENGHRVKGMQKDRPKMHTYKPAQNPSAYFGTHLLPLYPGKRVAIVESEKTAIVGALTFPQYIWIATGSKGNLAPHSDGSPRQEWEPLRGRTLHLFPDADGVSAWSSHASAMKAQGYDAIIRDEIVKQLPPKSKWDIADVILYEKEKGA